MADVHPWWQERASLGAEAALQASWDEPTHTRADGVAHCLDRITPHLGDMPVVLDLGCGAGRLAVAVAIEAHDAWVVGADPSPAMLDAAKTAWSQPPNVEWVLTDGRTLPQGRWDVAYSVAVFQHLPHDPVRSYLRQLAEAAYPGGRLVFQHVIGTETGPLCHEVPSAETLAGWCEDAGWSDVQWERDSVFGPWVWVSARIPH